MVSELSHLCVPPDCSLRQAAECINKNSQGIVLVTDRARKLLGTITDGDIRRSLLAGKDLETPVSDLLALKASSPYPQPIAAPVGTDSAELLQLMEDNAIYQIPLLDREGCVLDLVTMRDLLPSPAKLSLQAVVMAGGFGTRLRPLTEDLPKPMLPVGDRPLLEHIIEQLRESGIHQVNLTTHYKGEAITQHFGEGENFGVQIQYVEETRPLGTAGALNLLKNPDEPLLVINGDILTKVNFRSMMDFHQENHADMTVAVREQEFQIPYGVVETNGVEIAHIQEKPVLRHFISAGIYLLDPTVCQAIPQDSPYDMPSLIADLIARNRRVVSFPIHEYWLDIGQLKDYQKAVADIQRGEI